MKRRRTILLAITITPVLAVAGFLIVYATSLDLRNRVKLHVHYRDYLAWKEQGGPYRNSLVEPLILDRRRGSMVTGLSYDQIRRKFPGFIDGDQYPPTSYKGKYLKDMRQQIPEAKLLWFRPEDEFDFCVSITNAKTEINLVKG